MTENGVLVHVSETKCSKYLINFESMPKGFQHAFRYELFFKF